MKINDKGPALQNETHNKFHVSQQGFFNLASDLMPAVLPANQMSFLKIFVNLHELQHGNHLVIQAPGMVVIYTLVDKHERWVLVKLII